MSLEWWKLSQKELAQDEQAQLEKQMAYFRVFLGTTDGRRILLDIQRECYDDNGYWNVYSQEGALAVRATIEIYHRILRNCGCGIEALAAGIDGMASAAKLSKGD